MKRRYKGLVILLLCIMFVQVFSCINVVKAEEDTPLIIVLDPGHGGIDPGAVNSGQGLIERDIVMKIAQYLKAELEQYDDVLVYFTHSGLGSGQELALRDRGDIAANYKADIVVSLHINAVGGTGAEIYVTRDTGEQKYNADSTKLGNLILKNLGALGIGNRGVKTKKGNTITSNPKEYYYGDMEVDYYGIIRYPRIHGIPSILVEHCFIDSSDTQFLNSEQKIKNLAKADADAIVEHFKLVKTDPTKVKKVSLNKTSSNIYIGDKETLVATVLPATAINKNVAWTSSDTSVAQVSTAGVVTALKEGTATITAKTVDGAKEAKTVINIKPYIHIDEKEIYLLEGNKSKLTITVPEEAKGKESISVSDSTVISVDSKGVITALKEGTSEVIIKANGKEVRKLVTVTKPKAGQDIKINNLKTENDMLSKIKDKTVVSNFKTNFVLGTNLEVVVKNHKGVELKDTEIIGTGSMAQIREKDSKKVIQSYESMIYGDINKDGQISASDYVFIKNHIMETNILNNKDLLAADVSREGDVSAKDYVFIKNYIMNDTALSIE